MFGGSDEPRCEDRYAAEGNSEFQGTEEEDMGLASSNTVLNDGVMVSCV